MYINIEKILEIIYPLKCGFCSELIKEYYTCKKCRKKLKYICVKENKIRIENSYFDYLVTSYRYLGIIREKILEFKFKNKKYLYSSLTEYLVEILKDSSIEFDIIIPVPISFKRYLERGYNQSMLIAKFISKKLNKKLKTNVLYKKTNNLKQSSLTQKERQNNVKDVYCVKNKKIIENKKILLVDDIFTTGATVNECSKILKYYGAKSIIVATIAKA